MSTADPKLGMTPAQHLRQAEHLLSELSFEAEGMPAVRWRDRFYDALSMEYPRIVAHLQSRAWLHARIAEVQASLPQEVSIMPAQDWEHTPVVSAPSVSVDAEQARWLLECVKASSEEGWTPPVGDRESDPHDTDGVVCCEACLQPVLRYQASQGVRDITQRRVDAVVYWPECAWCWRSHRCGKTMGHPGGHECECGDTPYVDDELYVAS